MTRIVGIFFILVAIAICVSIYGNIVPLFEAFMSDESSITLINQLAIEFLKAAVAFLLLRTGIKWVK